MDNLQKTHPHDALRINIHESYELRDWSQKFGITHEHLIRLVQRYGTMAGDVRRGLAAERAAAMKP